MELFKRLEQFAAEKPFAPALIGDQSLVNYRLLFKLVNQASNHLLSAKVDKGIRVALIIEHPIVFIAYSLACLRIGAIQVAFPDAKTFEGDAALLNRLDLSLAVSDNSQLSVNIPTLFADQRALNNYPEVLDTPFAQPEDLVFIVIGSGTTGAQKLIPVTLRNIEILIERDKTAQKIEELDRYLALSPIYYYTSTRRMMATLLAGATFIVREQQRENFLEYCNRLAITHIGMVITHAHQMLSLIQNKDYESHRLPLLKTLFIGSAPVSEELRQDLKRFISPNLFVFYGPNEFGGTFRADASEQNTNPHTLGFPIEGVEIEIVDDDDQKVKQGIVGHLRLKAEGMIDAYLDSPEESEKAFKDGWFYPKDLAIYADNGAVIFQGRSDDLIIYQGVNIYPKEIEAILEEHPLVQDAAVFPMTTGQDSTPPAAAVVLKDPTKVNSTDGDIFIQHCKQKLDWRAPKKVLVLESFPRNTAGKILKKELIKLI